MLSLVVPAYNEAELIPLFNERITELLPTAGIEYELIFVDDGSKDETWNAIWKAKEENPNVRGISFSRNFGKEAAMLAGLSEANGDCAVVLDCDLQHPPELILEMYNLWKEGYEVVEGVKRNRGKESGSYSLSAKIFYSIMSRSMGQDMSRASDFKLLDRKAIDAVLSMREQNAFFRALSAWVGFKSVSIEYDVAERPIGKSKWSKRKLIRYAMSNITAFTGAPLHVITILGVIMLIVSVVFSLITLIQKIMGIALGGFTTVIILQMFIGSILMISLGIIGYYLAQIHEEIKSRPRFIVSKRL